MNRKPLGSTMLLGKAVGGFLSFKEAEGLTARSFDSYKVSSQKRGVYRGFMAWAARYKPSTPLVLWDLA